MRTSRPKLGVFSKLSKYSIFDCFITQLVNKLQQWSLYEVIEDILPFVLNTKRPLSDIWLLRYKQIVLGVFEKIQNFNIFKKHPKLFCLLLTNQISLRGRFVFKTNGRISSITSYKDHWCSFYTSWVINQWKSCILKILKNTQLWAYCAHPQNIFQSFTHYL